MIQIIIGSLFTYGEPIIENDINKVSIVEQSNSVYDEISEKATNHLLLLKSGQLPNILFTSEWLYNNFGRMDGFDNTFICSGFLKVVEKLLFQVIINDYEQEAIQYFQEETNSRINIDRFYMLGKMSSFLKDSRDLPASLSDHFEEFFLELNEWKETIRNGYFHKDFLTADEVKNVRNKTLKIIYYILGMVPKK